MDGTINNPQHYTPLSHALNPPFAATRPRSPYPAPPYDTQHQHPQQPQDQQSADHHDPAADSSNRLEEEEEEDVDDMFAIDTAEKKTRKVKKVSVCMRIYSVRQ